MLFNSWGYLLFLFIFVPLYWVMPTPRRRVTVIAVASVLFYAMWRWDFCFLVVFSAAIDFFVSRRIHGTQDKSKKKSWLLVSLCVNIGLLVFFKYTYFIAANLGEVAELVGGSADTFSIPIKILLPLGISFYTFQTVSYSIDVYRGVAEPEENFTVFLAYVMFWPQLIAGPVLRAGEVLPELLAQKNPRAEDFAVGARRILQGLTKKVCLADSLALSVDAAFGRDLSTFTALDTWVVAFLFGFQIYFDFSGYSEMAVGSARLLGIRFPENFNWPYVASSPRDFWGRWHISLSSWIRDYLYLPLTGQAFRTKSSGGLQSVVSEQSGKTRNRNLALLLTWFIMGLWHGAAWTFAFWGMFHAVWIFIYRKIPILENVGKRFPLVGIVITLPVAMAGWIPFRVQTGLGDALMLLGKLVTPSEYRFVGHILSMYDYFWAAIFTVLFLSAYAFSKSESLRSVRDNPISQILWITVLVLSSLLFMGRIQTFIYFQF